MLAKITAVLTFIGALAVVVTSDVGFITKALTDFPTGNLIGGFQDLGSALAITAGALHIHLKFNFLGVNVDSGV